MCTSDQKEETLISAAVPKTFGEWKADTVEVTARGATRNIFSRLSYQSTCKVRVPCLTEDLKQGKEEVVIVPPLFRTPTEVRCLITATGQNPSCAPSRQAQV